MIRFSAFLVVVAVGTLVAGVVTSKLLLVYIAIGVSGLALLALGVGAAVNWRELTGKPEAPVTSASTAQADAAQQAVPPQAAAPEPAQAPAVAGKSAWPAAVPAGAARGGYLPPGGPPSQSETPTRWDLRADQITPPSPPPPARDVAEPEPDREDDQSLPDQTLIFRAQEPAGADRPAGGEDGEDGEDDAAATASKPATAPGPEPPAGAAIEAEAGPAASTEAAPAGKQAPAGERAPADDAETAAGNTAGNASGDDPVPDDATVVGERPSSDDGPAAAEPAGSDDDLEVTVVPGVPRYHKAQCILIRFMGDSDLDKMTVAAAREAGCTPCRACLPE